MAMAFTLFLAVAVLGGFVPKNTGDQNVYLILAAKLGQFGLDPGHYSDAAVHISHGREDTDIQFVSPAASEDVRPSYRPPLYPLMLLAAHRLVRGDRPIRLLQGPWKYSHYADEFARSLPTALAAAFFFLAVGALAREARVPSVLAQVLALGSPVVLIAAFKVWSDLPAAAFIAWSVVVWRRSGSAKGAAASGLLFALAVLTRVQCLAVLPLFLARCDRKKLVSWAAVFVPIVLPWFLLMNAVYGSPIYFPHIEGAKSADPWLRKVLRPWHAYLSLLVILSPAFLMVFGALKRAFVFYMVWFLSVLAPLIYFLLSPTYVGVEERYLILAYPALAVWAAAGCQRALESAHSRLATAIIAGFIFWSAGLALVCVLSRRDYSFLAGTL
jgi:hypothetical protein